jgi:hypothetical protein
MALLILVCATQVLTKRGLDASAERIDSSTSHPSFKPPWDRLSVPELRALLREVPIDRTSLPAPIENLRRAELVEALRQVEALQSCGGSWA